MWVGWWIYPPCIHFLATNRRRREEGKDDQWSVKRMREDMLGLLLCRAHCGGCTCGQSWANQNGRVGRGIRCQTGRRWGCKVRRRQRREAHPYRFPSLSSYLVSCIMPSFLGVIHARMPLFQIRPLPHFSHASLLPTPVD